MPSLFCTGPFLGLSPLPWLSGDPVLEARAPEGPSGRSARSGRQKLRRLKFVLLFLLAGCATPSVRTPEQAKAIALSSVCAQRTVILAPNETMPTQWRAERRGARWYAWLPFSPDARYSGITEYGHMGAWINPKDGKVLVCEAGMSRPAYQAAPQVRIASPPVPGSIP
jgi:hypothetical protein